MNIAEESKACEGAGIAKTETRGNARISNYKLVKTIGKGHYSKVKLAQDKRSGQFLAIKIIKRHHVEWLSLPTFRKILHNEVNLLQNIKHKSIINLIDWNCQGEVVVQNSGRAVQIFFIVLELVEQGDLFSFIKLKNDSGGFSERYARYYFTQMLDAIEYLHSTAGVVHRDLKPENLLLSHDYQLKIADFGLSAHRDGEQGTGIHYSSVGTRQYQAPEVLEQKSYRGDRVDIYSMGVILFTMVTGAMPYLTEASFNDPLYKLILRRSKEDYWDCWKTIRESNTTAKIQETLETIPDTSFIEDLTEAVKNCTRSFCGSLMAFLHVFLNVLKFVVTLGQNRDLFRGDDMELEQDKYAFSEEFKDLVFDMMAYNHRQRPTITEIRNHPWMRQPQQGQHTEEQLREQEAELKKDVIRDMTKLKQSRLVKQLRQGDGDAPELDSQGSDVGSMLPTKFQDFMQFQYNTNESTSNFLWALLLFIWNKLSQKLDCRRGDQLQVQQFTGSQKRKNSDVVEVPEAQGKSLLESVASQKGASKQVTEQHQLLVGKLKDTLKGGADGEDQLRPYMSPRGSFSETQKRLKVTQPLDMAQNPSSSINNWLDDQFKKESSQRKMRIRTRMSGELVPNELMPEEGREN